MKTFKVIAQHEISSQRIQKVVTASSEAEVLRAVSAELADLQYYIAGIYPD